jgi:diguanylate cyclase (GGDEF)-like protein/PAS domain S-box-containing protein
VDLLRARSSALDPGRDLFDRRTEQFLDRLGRLTARLLGVPAASITLIDSDRQVTLAQTGMRRPADPAAALLAASSFPAEVAAAEEPLTVTQIDARAHAGVPVLGAGRCLGAVCVFQASPREWTSEDVRALQDLAAIVAHEIDRYEAETDGDCARAELNEHEEHIRLAFDAAAIGIVTVSLEPGSEGRLLRVNDAFCQFLGRSESELKGRTIEELTHPEDREASQELIGALASCDERILRRIEKRYLHADGHTVWGALTTSAPAAPDSARTYVIALIEDITERKHADQDLPAIANVLRRILSGEDAREAIVQAAVDIAGASSSYLLERDGAEDLVVTASVGGQLKGVQIPLGLPSATAHTYLSGEPLFMADPSTSPLVSSELLKLSGGRSVMWQPIFRHEEVLGVLCVCWAERVNDLSTRAARAVALLTDETAVALAHHAALQRLAAQATTDGLTGLPNRRAWDERLAREIASARRLQRPVTLAVLDMDRFKRYNDTYGHAAGDELLRTFGEHAQPLLRDSDTLARWGGEEFALLLPDCPSSSFAETTLGRVRAAVPAGQSCSAGYATWNGVETPDQLMRRADRALYRAKATGRNRAVCADAERSLTVA